MENQNKCKVCAIIGATPNEQPWGYDEEYFDCVMAKTRIAMILLEVIRQGCHTFISSLEQGTEMWAAEACTAIRDYGGDIELVCVPTSESQADRWHPERRERYFRLLQKCSEVIEVDDEVIDSADEYILENADLIIKQGPLGERADSLFHRAVEMGKRIIEI